MRSTGITLVLALAAALLCALAAWQWKQGSFEVLFGQPPRPLGGQLYDSFAPGDVKHIRIRSGEAAATFSLGEDGWHATTPWDDRMDPRAALAIIQFTLGMRVEDVAEADEVDEAKSGLGEAAVRIRLENASREPLANYQLGRVSPWKAEVEGQDTPVASVFVQPRDRHRKKHIYICSGDITPLFKDGLRFLRDHRPFYFNPANLEKIRIRSQQGDITLGRTSPAAPWRITKPLDLPTDPVAIKSLLEGMYELQALRVSDRAAAALPATEGMAKPAQIAITPFGTEEETVLEIYPPETPDAKEAGAVVSDRPNTWFILPTKPEGSLVSLADLPLTMNELRDPVLTRLNVASLRAIALLPATGTAIEIRREPPGPWTTVIDGVPREANEENLYNLLKTVTSARAVAFESDAATDFTPWGLDRPVLRLIFRGAEDQGIELRFGLDRHGQLFVNREGTPTVVRVDESLLSGIVVRPQEWRHARLWSLNRVNLVGIERQTGNEPPLVLRYDFIGESWQATRAGQDLSAMLDPARANQLLARLEGLKVARWLPTDDAQTATALASPSLILRIAEKQIDEDGNFIGLTQRTLRLAPGAGATAGFFHGRADGEPYPFLIDGATYGQLAAELMEK